MNIENPQVTAEIFGNKKPQLCGTSGASGVAAIRQIYSVAVRVVLFFYKMEERQFFRKPAAVRSGGFGQFKGAGTVFVRPLGTVFSAFSVQSLSAPSVCHRHSFHGRLVSRVLCARRRRDHLSVTAVADSLSATSEDSDGQPRVSSLLTAVLLPIGFTLTDFVSEAPVGSYPAFSPLHFCRCFLLHFP